MASQVVQWLNDEIGPLSCGRLGLKELPSAFASGALFHEVLSLIQPLAAGAEANGSSGVVISSKRRDARLSNLSALAELLKDAGCTVLTPSLLVDIMTEQPGSAALLLLKLRKLGPLSKGASAQQQELGISSTKSGQAKRRNQAITAEQTSMKELLFVAQQRKYHERQLDREIREQERRGKEAFDADEFSKNRRRAWLARRKVGREFQGNWEANRRKDWTTNQAEFVQSERRLLAYELAVLERAKVARDNGARVAQRDARTGCLWFERNMNRLSLSPSATTTAGDLAGYDSSESSVAFRGRLEEMAARQNWRPESNAEVMATLKHRGITGRKSQAEREYRRRKNAGDQRQAQAVADLELAERCRLEDMVRAGRCRRAAAAQLWESRQASLHKAELRRTSNEARRRQLSADFEADFSKRAEITREAHERVAEERRACNEALRAKYLLADRERRGKRIAEVCSGACRDLVELAMQAAGQKHALSFMRHGEVAHGDAMTPSEWKALKRHFVKQSLPGDIRQGQEGGEEAGGEEQGEEQVEEQEQEEEDERFSFGQDSLSQERDPAALVQREIEQLLAEEEDPQTGLELALATCGKAGGLGLSSVAWAPADGDARICERVAKCLGHYCFSMQDVLAAVTAVALDAIASVSASKKAKTSATEAAAAAAAEGKLEREQIEALAYVPETRQEDRDKFVTASVNFHTAQSKAKAPPTLATTNELLVLHLQCKAPRDRGWMLLNYPTTVEEAELLERGLAELESPPQAAVEDVKGSKAKRKGTTVGKEKKTKGVIDTAAATTEAEPAPAARSRLHAVFDFRTTDLEAGKASEQADDEEGGQQEEADDEDHEQKRAEALLRWWGQEFPGNRPRVCKMPRQDDSDQPRATPEQEEERLVERLGILVTMGTTSFGSMEEEEAMIFEKQALMRASMTPAKRIWHQVRLGETVLDTRALSKADSIWTEGLSKYQKWIERRKGSFSKAASGQALAAARAEQLQRFLHVEVATPPAARDSLLSWAEALRQAAAGAQGAVPKRAWLALDDFELAAGNVAETLHLATAQGAEALAQQMELDVHAWCEGPLLTSALQLCTEELELHTKRVELVRNFHALVGPPHFLLEQEEQDGDNAAAASLRRHTAELRERISPQGWETARQTLAQVLVTESEADEEEGDAPSDLLLLQQQCNAFHIGRLQSIIAYTVCAMARCVHSQERDAKKPARLARHQLYSATLSSSRAARSIRERFHDGKEDMMAEVGQILDQYAADSSRGLPAHDIARILSSS